MLFQLETNSLARRYFYGEKNTVLYKKVMRKTLFCIKSCKIKGTKLVSTFEIGVKSKIIIEK